MACTAERSMPVPYIWTKIPRFQRNGGFSIKSVRIPYAERILAIGREVLLALRLAKSISHEFGSTLCVGFIKNLVYFLCKVCYTGISVHRGWADPGKIKRNTRAFTRAEGPSTRRFRVKGDGAGRLELVRFFAHTPDFLLIERTQYRTLASLTEGGGPRSGGGSVLKQSIHRLLYSTPPVSYR